MTKRTKRLLALMAAKPKLRRVSGLPPLSYTAKKAGFLTDYRIYGQTSRNLFEKELADSNINNTGAIVTLSGFILSIAPVKSGVSYTISRNATTNVYAFYDELPTIGSVAYDETRVVFNSETVTFTAPITGYIAVRSVDTDPKLMINEGFTPLPYEPYGESVGDRTGNLFDGEWTQGGVGNIGSIDNENQNRIKTIISVTPSQTYTIRTNLSIRMIFAFNDTTELSGRVSNLLDIANGVKFATITIPNNANLIAVALMSSDNSNITPNDVEWTMLNSGSEPLPYEPYGYKVSVTVSNGTDTLTTPIYLLEPIKMVGDEAEYIDYAEQKQHRVRKNLLQNTATSQTINGVTFTVNADGSVTCNGTASETVFYKIGVAPFGNCILNGCPQNGSANSYLLRIIEDITSFVRCTDFGGGATANITNTSRCEIRIYSNYTCDNLTFYPMIRNADITDDTYEPYITDTELNVTLPALPTVAGTNVLSVETEVQPSLVEVTGRIRPVPTGGGD